MDYFLTLIICFLSAVLLTPIVKQLAFKINATDTPNQRKVHQKIMPRMGGLAIFISFLLGVILLNPYSIYTPSILIGAFVIVITGIIDDITELSAKIKLIGQIGAALIVVVWGNLHIEFINIPFGGIYEFGSMSIPITVLWIVGITNALNLIDGLDGLASGVSAIALLTISGMAFLQGDVYVATLSILLVMSVFGFLIYNFYPASIFLGDTGSMLLGFMISVFAVLGFKNITVVSLIIPIIILGVPISDTFFAVVRRIVQRKPLTAPDKSHLHHCLLRLGYSHQQVVLIIYAIAAFFSIMAIIFSQATVYGALVIIVLLILLVELLVEGIGLIGVHYKPILKKFGFKRD
jgi:UDP-GlcNAc:undecaprenyl-phosphate/decaprenyl-phosphate GlcNAc-1-phosphate transferase